MSLRAIRGLMAVVAFATQSWEGKVPPNDRRIILILLLGAKSSGLCAESKKHCRIFSPRSKPGRGNLKGRSGFEVRTSRTSLRIKAVCDKSAVLQPLPLCFLFILNGSRGQMPFAFLCLQDLFLLVCFSQGLFLELFLSLQPLRLLSFSGKRAMARVWTS